MNSYLKRKPGSEADIHPLLRYARHYGLATKHQITLHAADLVEDLTRIQSNNESRALSIDQDARLTDDSWQQNACVSVEEEKATITAVVSRRLQHAIDTLNHREFHSRSAWLLPDLRKTRSLKIEPPLLLLGGGDPQKDSSQVRKISDVSVMLQTTEQHLRSDTNLLSKDSETWKSHAKGCIQAWQIVSDRESLQVDRAVVQRLTSVLLGEQPKDIYGFIQSDPLERVSQTLLIDDLDSEEYAEAACVDSMGSSIALQIQQPCTEASSPQTLPEVSIHTPAKGAMVNSEPASELEFTEYDFDNFIDWESNGIAMYDVPGWLGASSDEIPLSVEHMSSKEDPEVISDVRSTDNTKLYVSIPVVPTLEARCSVASPTDIKQTLNAMRESWDTAVAIDVPNRLASFETSHLMVDEVLQERSGKFPTQRNQRVICSADLLSRTGEIRYLTQTPHDCEYLLLDDEDHNVSIGFSPTTRFNVVVPSSSCSRHLEGHHPRKIDETVISRSPTSCQGVNRLSKPTLKRKLGHEADISFSASSSLSTFLNLRGRSYKQARLVTNSSMMVNDCVESAPKIVTSSSQQKDDSLDTATSIFMQCQIPLPDVPNRTGSCVIILNNDLLQTHPSLVTFLEEKTSERLTIIYRDFNSTFEAIPHIIISPTTCILLTNVQSLLQRLLPGQTASSSMSMLHQSISQLSISFRKIFVLVLRLVPSSIEARYLECQTFVKFTGFCASLSMSLADLAVKPIWIQYTNVTHLSASLNTHAWALISSEITLQESRQQNSMLSGSTPLQSITMIQDETLWEIFLRKLGLNCMAAQIVLSALQAHGHEHESQVGNGCHTEPWGLARFVCMSAQERLEMFGSVFGTRILSRTSRILDQTNIGQLRSSPS